MTDDVKKSGKPDDESGARISDSKVIMRRLRSYYESVQDMEIPERLLDLVERLDQAEREAKGSKKQ